MSVVAGDVLEVTFNHPTIGSGTFFPKAGEDSTFDLGGFRSSDDANMVDGGGNMIDQMNRVRWSLECTLANDMNNRQDLEKLTDLASSPVLADWTITHINGRVYGGKGKPVGDINANGNTSNMTLKLAGGGRMSQIV